MSKEQKKESPKDLKFVTSLALAVANEESKSVDHLQFSIFKESDTGEYRCYFDVVDPSKIKLAQDDVHQS